MLDWFTTIPGILIVCGVILLVIAIILFILDNKKSKTEKVNDSNLSNLDNNNNSVDNSTQLNTTVDVPNINNDDVINISTNINNSIAENTSSNDTDSVNLETNTSSDLEVNTIKIDEPLPVSDNLASDNTVIFDNQFSNSVVDGNLSMNKDNTNPSPISIDIPVINANPISSGETSVDNPSNDAIKIEKPVTIYGGNDPLEATQSLPKMDVHHEPYGGAYKEVKIVEPTVNIQATPVDDVIPAPVNEPSVATTNNSFSFTPVENVHTDVTPISIPSDDTKNTVEEL